MNHFSIFTGIGGIDLAAEMVGFTTVGQVEWAEFPRKVLQKHWPNVPKWGDVRDVTAAEVYNRGIHSITLLSAGFPCQPYSQTGKKKGHLDARDMWQETSRLISELRPTWFLGENVNGIKKLALPGILEDIRSKNYEVVVFNIPACLFEAPHERYRVFIVGYSNSQPKSQADKATISIRSQRNTWQSITCESRNKASRTYWEQNQSPICGMDDGFSDRFYKDRMISLGNAVVPQQIYPLLKTIAEIERCTNE